MPFALFQAGTSLQMVDTSGNGPATLTLPTGVALTSTKTPRFAIFNRYVVMVNSPSRPITIDGDGVCRVLCPRPPVNPATLSAQGSGGLTGTYVVKRTFRITDAQGNLIAESDFSPVSASQAVAAQYLRAANLDVSPDDITSSMLYRPTTGGTTTFFPWVELNGNTQTSIQDDLSDAGLSLVAAATLGSVPDLTLICEYKGRLWGVDENLIDDLRYCEAGKMYAWPASRTIPIPKLGSDSRGIIGLGSSRDALLVGRRNNLHQNTGENSTNFAPKKISENCGILSHESIAVYNNSFYFLWYDGVYRWDASGLTCLSDGVNGKGRVRSWFTTDSYFNRGKFNIAAGMIDPIEKRYRLFLCAAGSTVLDRWIDYDIQDGTFWGPHKTGAFTPVSTLTVPTADDVQVTMIGSSNGYLWKEQLTKTDDTATAIDFDVDTKRHDGQTPDIDKVWGLLSMLGIKQSQGAVIVTPYVGELDAPASTRTLRWDMQLARQVLGHIGRGKHLMLNLRENTVGHDVLITGYEQQFHEAGKR